MFCGSGKPVACWVELARFDPKIVAKLTRRHAGSVAGRIGHGTDHGLRFGHDVSKGKVKEREGGTS